MRNVHQTALTAKAPIVSFVKLVSLLIKKNLVLNVPLTIVKLVSVRKNVKFVKMGILWGKKESVRSVKRGVLNALKMEKLVNLVP